ncbi:SIR2 family protein [Candidatus Parcubacteria bacterium]|nr:SIR2 family protein [Candidatus Parcubacteria bacterium]
MTTHNPKQFIEQLQTILSNPSKKIGFLFGAGISMKYKSKKDSRGVNIYEDLIPSISKMTEKAVDIFSDDPQKAAIEIIKKEIEENNEQFNIETLLSKISQKERAAGEDKLCKLSKKELLELRKDIEKEIIKLVSVHDNEKKKLDIQTTNQNTFCQWIKNASREFPVEIFTTNYDYLLELSLENYQIQYFDGFIGSYNAFFCPEWIEDDSSVEDWVKLWKLHGSLGWLKNDKNEIIRTSRSSDEAVIYPSFLKYDHSKKQPYLSYMDRLSHFLRQEDSVLFVCGYSFGDEHINETILTALTRSRSSSVIVLKFEKLDGEDSLCKEIAEQNSRISVYAKRTAVIGCKFGKWKLEKEPNRNESYNIVDHGFDEDATLEEEVKTSTWTGKGDFILGDFEKFTNFLSLFFTGSKYLKKENNEK